MSLERVKQYFSTLGLENRVKILTGSSATVEQAAQTLGCLPEKIAKTMSFTLNESQNILIVMAGDARVDNKKYKSFFGKRAKMIPKDSVEQAIGHSPGGVCPFAIKPNVDVYLDESLRNFDWIYPAAGDSQSAVELTPDELEKYSSAKNWIDVAKG
ncbi:YbaK/EbsC family protein [Tetragenococcus koreensis]|uniref:YbaK/aminoacyl-tRNA synthetase-associated domain-containing protein n=1 Tax=Tetragenococcus koreensis TaxID=290335 RepID=A0AAN4UDY8_9ENTE|nr:YbaK/EbsC family protein [Tetragenococcus koreensis]MDN6641329.1 YbaK/EbsC family protein [Tetragenococcus sp.]MCF1586279.1 YbaK/EbsC family protein [Tetragenococcus koreensis]MCF1615860.1 YbaK/EbsC family protein [Tetragenococcus koreensis]MCF1625643.1 YbaK/EbsC family protein [Tetragenococcus koreensis]MCF1628158.1 YbaK/EbsC family protein [Tetragenococcus koreensis]